MDLERKQNDIDLQDKAAFTTAQELQAALSQTEQERAMASKMEQTSRSAIDCSEMQINELEKNLHSTEKALADAKLDFIQLSSDSGALEQKVSSLAEELAITRSDASKALGKAVKNTQSTKTTCHRELKAVKSSAAEEREAARAAAQKSAHKLRVAKEKVASSKFSCARGREDRGATGEA